MGGMRLPGLQPANPSNPAAIPAINPPGAAPRGSLGAGGAAGSAPRCSWEAVIGTPQIDGHLPLRLPLVRDRPMETTVVPGVLWGTTVVLWGWAGHAAHSAPLAGGLALGRCEGGIWCLCSVRLLVRVRFLSVLLPLPVAASEPRGHGMVLGRSLPPAPKSCWEQAPRHRGQRWRQPLPQCWRRGGWHPWG